MSTRFNHTATRRRPALPLAWIAILSMHFAAAPVAAEVPPARDGAIAMQQEFAAALATPGNAALILFIARFPDAALADQARRTLAARPLPDPVPASGPDGAIILEFDRARLAGPAALAAFAARNPDHPLALEAADPFWTGGR